MANPVARFRKCWRCMTSFSCLDAEKFLSPRPEQPLNCVFSYLSAEQRAAGFGEADVSPAFVQDQPAMGDRIIKAGLVFSRCALRLEQKRSIDLLDADVAVLRAAIGFEQIALWSDTNFAVRICRLCHGKSPDNFGPAGVVCLSGGIARLSDQGGTNDQVIHQARRVRSVSNVADHSPGLCHGRRWRWRRGRCRWCGGRCWRRRSRCWRHRPFFRRIFSFALILPQPLGDDENDPQGQEGSPATIVLNSKLLCQSSLALAPQAATGGNRLAPHKIKVTA